MMRVVVGQPFHPGFCRRRSALTPPFCCGFGRELLLGNDLELVGRAG